MRLCRAAYLNGRVRDEIALRVASGGTDALSKQEVPHLILYPLRRRDYLQRQGDITDWTSRLTVWKIVNWNQKNRGLRLRDYSSLVTFSTWISNAASINRIANAIDVSETTTQPPLML